MGGCGRRQRSARCPYVAPTTPPRRGAQTSPSLSSSGGPTLGSQQTTTRSPSLAVLLTCGAQ